MLILAQLSCILFLRCQIGLLLQEIFQFIHFVQFQTVNKIQKVISLLGEKLTLIVGSSTYVLYLSLFLYPNNPCLYVYSVIIGVGAAILWTAQGSLMVKYSTRETMDRNATIFWALFQVSLIEPHRPEPLFRSNHPKD